jgi:hypothetical protein
MPLPHQPMLARLKTEGPKLISDMLLICIHTVRKISEKTQPRQRTGAHLQGVNRTLDHLRVI